MTNENLKNLYEILGVDKEASPKEIKKAYYKLARDHHPDKNGGEESQDFINISMAYNILIDKIKRSQYDETGEYDSKPFDVKRRTRELLAGVLTGLIKDPNWEYTKVNLFKLITKNIGVESDKQDNQKMAVCREIERLEDIEQRITGRDSMFNEVVRNELRMQKNIQAKLEQDKEILEEALNLIRDYKYKTDEQSFLDFIDPNILFGGTGSTI